MPWKIIDDGRLFQKQYRKYARDKQVCASLEQYLKYAPQEEDPARIGSIKQGRYAGVFAYNLTKSIRLMYKVDYQNCKIILETMGSHKEVYGRG